MHPAPASAQDVRTVAKGGAVQITGQLAQRGLMFVFTAVAVRLLEAAGYGLYRQIAQVLAVAAQLGLLGFNYAAMRFIARARAAGDHGLVRGSARVALAGTTVASLIVVGGILLLAPQIASWFADSVEKQPEFALLLRLGALYVPFFALMQVLRYCTQAYKDMVPSVIVGNLVQPIARFILGLAALLAGFAVAGAVSTLVLSMAVGTGAGAYFYLRILSKDEIEAQPRMEVAPIIKFALPQAGTSMLGLQSLGLGIIVLGILSSDRQAGLFAIALALQAPASVFLSGVVNIWAPVVSSLHGSGDMQRLASLYQAITRWVVTFSLPILVALILKADLMVRLYVGPGRADAADIAVALAVGNILYVGTGPTGFLISMTGHPGVNLINSVAAVAAYAVGGILVVPEYGALGMAFVDAAVTTLVNIARIVEVKLLVGMQPFGRSFLKPVLATVAGASVVLVSEVLPWSGTIADILRLVAGAVVFIAVLRGFGLDPEERVVWEGITRRLRRLRSGDRG